MKSLKQFIPIILLLCFLTAIIIALVLLTIYTDDTPLTQPDGIVGEDILGGEDEMLGASYPNAKWMLINKFDGYQTKFDPAKISNGANPQGQNTTINEGDRISIRNQGFELFPEDATQATSTTPIKTLHTFRKRDGSNIMIRTYGTVIEYLEEDNDTWETLKTGLTTGKKFGFADYNINTDLHSYTYFGNGYDNAMRWSGDITITDGVLSGGETTITVDSTDGFLDTGSIIYCGTEIAYSARDATTFTVASAHACADNRGIAQVITEYATHPEGNIYLTANNRLFIAGITDVNQAVYFSEYGDATNFVGADLVLDSTDTSPGIFNLGEGGGAVKGMLLDENSIYIFKKSIIYKATLNDTTYTLDPLKPFDGKSQTIGGVHNQSVFSGGNGIFFITPDNQIMYLTRVEGVDYPQVVPISDIIKLTLTDADFSSSAGIVFKDKAYFSFKTLNTDTYNNTVFVYNIKNQFWDSPIVGWNVSDFTIYDNETSEELYFADANSNNTYKVIDVPIDNENDVKASWRSKQFDFGSPHLLKQIVGVYVEGYISPNTELNISLLADENGYTQIASTDFLGTETDYLFDAEDYNLFGLSAFGTKRFGAQAETALKKKFRVYLNKGLRIEPIYNAQIEFLSDGENMQWEISGIGIQYRIFSQPIKNGLIRKFN